jgi:uncharacterized membrane protein YheB (UPF0754 family)
MQKLWVMLVYLAPPVLGAFIGYITNVVAVELLFHPKKPVNIFGFKIQGLVPARSKEIVERIMGLSLRNSYPERF